MQFDDISEKHKKEKTACCCGWGGTCQRIRAAFLALPPGSEFDLYKMPHVFIKRGTTNKAEKMADVLQRHLMMKDSLPKSFVIARHHFSIELLEWHENKKRQWLSPLTLEEAQGFGIADHVIDHHPVSLQGKNKTMLCQVPNMTKDKLLTIILSFNLARGQQQKK